MLQKFRILGAENNTDETQKALENSLYMLYQSGVIARTENTAGEPIEPLPDYIEDYEKYIPTEDEQKVIDQINVLAESIKIEVVVIGGGGIKNPK